MINPKRDSSVCIQFLYSLLLLNPTYLDNDEDFKQKITELLLVKNNL